MLFALALLLAAPSQGYTPSSRDDIINAYRQILSGNDRDHDGKLSLAEWGTMIDAAFPATPRPDEAGSNYDEVRRSGMDEYRLFDADHDGFLTFDELVRVPLADFDCSDTDHNRILSEEEMWRGMTHCVSLTQTEAGWTLRGPAAASAGTSPPAR